DCMLRKDKIEGCLLSLLFHHALNRGRIEQILETAKGSITPHLPFQELMQRHSKLVCHGFGVGQPRAKDMNFVLSISELLDQIERFGRPASTRWEEGLVRDKGNSHLRHG